MIVTDRFPRLLLRAEAAVFAIIAVALYFLVDYPGWLLVVLALAPDLSMLAYLAGPRIGATLCVIVPTLLVLWCNLGPYGSAQAGRHFTVAVFVVWEGKVLLHRHRKLGMWLPPGGHIEKVELPDEAAVREV